MRITGLVALIYILFLAGCGSGTEATETTAPVNYEIAILEPEIADNIEPEIFRIETANFILRYYGEDAQVIKVVSDILESNFERITDILGVVPPRQTRVLIYASLCDFHRAVDWPDAEPWFVGWARVGAGEIYMVSPNNPGPVHSYDAMLKVAVHEFVHIAARELNPTLRSNFLAEGLATYLAGQYESVADTIQLRLYDSLTIPCVDTILGPYWDDMVYQVGFAFMQFIVAEFGYDGLVALYRDPDEFVLNNVGLNEMWMNFLDVNY